MDETNQSDGCNTYEEESGVRLNAVAVKRPARLQATPSMDDPNVRGGNACKAMMMSSYIMA